MVSGSKEHESTGLSCNGSFGNKADLAPLRVVSFRRAKEFADSHGLTYFETSALDLEQVEAVFSHNYKEYHQLLERGENDRNKPWTSPEYEEVSVVLLGEPHVGKTSIWKRYMDNDFNCRYHSTTVQGRRLKVLRLNGKRIKLDLCDSASGTVDVPLDMASMCTSIVVFDVKYYETFVQSHNIITWALKKTKSVLLVGNKYEGCFTDGQPDRMVTQEEAHHLADRHGIPYVEVSAKEGTNVEYAITMAATMALVNPLSATYDTRVSHEDIDAEADRTKEVNNKETVLPTESSFWAATKKFVKDKFEELYACAIRRTDDEQMQSASGAPV